MPRYRTEPLQRNYSALDATPIQPKPAKPRVRLVDGKFVPVERRAK